MGINLYGNLSDFSYRPAEVNLFEIAKKQDTQYGTIAEVG